MQHFSQARFPPTSQSMATAVQKMKIPLISPKGFGFTEPKYESNVTARSASTDNVAELQIKKAPSGASR